MDATTAPSWADRVHGNTNSDIERTAGMDQPEEKEREDYDNKEEYESPTSPTASSGDGDPKEDDHEMIAYAPMSRRNSNRSLPALSRHSSALSVVSALRARKVGTNTQFQHPLSHQKTSPDVVVGFDGPDDPYNPLNWPTKKKCLTTALYGLTTAGITFASAVYSAGIAEISEEFHVSNEVSVLGISLILVGFGLGPLLWAPLSEVYGRKPAVLIPYFLAAVFSFATAVAKDIQTVMITRFFAGFFGSAPITNTGGCLGDMFSPRSRGTAIAFYAAAVTGAPTLGPLIGGACVTSSLGWRWTEYLSGIIMMFFLCLDVIFLDESFAPVLLVWKARRLRHETGNWALHARHEEWDVSLRELAHKYLVRPFQMLSTPICFLVALHASFVYAVLYGNLSAFPIAFQELRGWNPVVGALPFLAMLIGIILGVGTNIASQGYYHKKFAENNNRAVPEARLPIMMLGSIVFTSGLFIFAWTSYRDVFWFGTVMGTVLIGFGFTTIFQQAINYLVDTFTKYGASAIAANTFMRSSLAAAFPLFITPMYHNLGVPWAGTVFACFSALLIPVPFLFFIYGRRLRALGKWSQDSL